MAKKGHKSMRNQPEIYDQIKRCRSVALTDDGWQGIDKLAKEKRLSRSEFLEQIGRGLLQIS